MTAQEPIEARALLKVVGVALALLMAWRGIVAVAGVAPPQRPLWIPPPIIETRH